VRVARRVRQGDRGKRTGVTPEPRPRSYLIGYVTPLDVPPALTRWMRAGLRCAPALHDGAGNSGPGLHCLGSEATVN